MSTPSDSATWRERPAPAQPRVSPRRGRTRPSGLAADAAPRSSAGARFGPWVRARVVELSAWTIPVLLLALWELAARFGLLSQQILPEPMRVLSAGARLLTSGELAHHAAISARRAFVGLVIGGGLGLFFGLLNGGFRLSERLFDTPLQMLRNIPHLALIPLVILWFGLGEEAKVFLVALGVLFPMYINTYHGVRGVDVGLLEMARNYGLSTAQIAWQVVLPSALPSILVGLRFSLGVMWLSLIVAETIATDAGLGYLAMNAREFMQTDVVVLSILIYALLGKVADTAARQLERLLIRGTRPRATKGHLSKTRATKTRAMGSQP